MMNRIVFKDGTFIETHVAVKPKQPPCFELAMCKRDGLGNRMSQPRTVYSGSNPRAVEACLLRSLSDVEKSEDIYAVPEPAEA